MPNKKVKQRAQVLKGSHGGMQLVLIEDVPHLGKRGQVVEVKNGYGRNYLLPNSLAVIPNSHNLKLLERYKIKIQQAREARVADLKVLAEQIQRIAVMIEENAHEEHWTDEAGVDHVKSLLYGSVSAHDISRELKAKNLQVEPEMVRLEAPIKELGVYKVEIALGFEIKTVVQVAVLPKQEAPPAKK